MLADYPELSNPSLMFFFHRHIENWLGLQTVQEVDMALYTGIQRL